MSSIPCAKCGYYIPDTDNPCRICKQIENDSNKPSFARRFVMTWGHNLKRSNQRIMDDANSIFHGSDLYNTDASPEESAHSSRSVGSEVAPAAPPVRPTELSSNQAAATSNQTTGLPIESTSSNRRFRTGITKLSLSLASLAIGAAISIFIVYDMLPYSAQTWIQRIH